MLRELQQSNKAIAKAMSATCGWCSTSLLPAKAFYFSPNWLQGRAGRHFHPHSAFPLHFCACDLDNEIRLGSTAPPKKVWVSFSWHSWQHVVVIFWHIYKCQAQGRWVSICRTWRVCITYHKSYGLGVTLLINGVRKMRWNIFKNKTKQNNKIFCIDWSNIITANLTINMINMLNIPI